MYFAYLLVYQQKIHIFFESVAKNAMIFDIVCNDPPQQFIEKRDYNHCNHSKFVGPLCDRFRYCYQLLKKKYLLRKTNSKLQTILHTLLDSLCDMV